MSKNDLHERLKGYPISYTWGGPRQCGSVGEGWHNLIIEAVEKMIAAGWDGKITQIKEKFGTLRFYIGQTSKEVNDIALEAEKKSSVTCETCGVSNETVKKSAGSGRWFKTLCVPCRNMYEASRNDPD